MAISFFQAKQLRQGAAKHLVLAFALLFLVLQTSNLLHSHNGDLHHHLDCTLCFKIGVGDDAITPKSATPSFSKARHSYAWVHEAPSFVAHVPASSRGPPLVS